MADIDFKEEDMSTLKDVINPEESELKNYVVDYVGNKLDPENENVDIEMVINVFAKEFPELVMALAEENWIRGYEQALSDVDAGKQIVEEHQKENDQSD